MVGAAGRGLAWAIGRSIPVFTGGNRGDHANERVSKLRRWAYFAFSLASESVRHLDHLGVYAIKLEDKCLEWFSRSGFSWQRHFPFHHLQGSLVHVAVCCLRKDPLETIDSGDRVVKVFCKVFERSDSSDRSAFELALVV